METTKEGPERTCVGCRGKKNTKDLRRLAIKCGPGGPVVVWDVECCLGGRGVWICRDNQECLGQAMKKRVWARAFRTQINLDLTKIESMN